MKRITITILVALLLIGTVTAYADSPFSDMKSSNWAYESVSKMQEKGIVEGFPDGSFKPNNTVTYGEFIKMALITATGEDVGNLQESSKLWALNYYNKGLELHYFDTDDISYTQLNDAIRRRKMALIISSILGDTDIQLSNKLSDVTYKTENQNDIIKVYSAGIITGYTDNTFQPDKTLTRAEASTVIYRLMDKSKRILPDAESNDVSESSELSTEKFTIDYGADQLQVEKKTVSLPFRGITVIAKPTKWIRVYSDTIQDFCLYTSKENIPMVGNADGTNYFIDKATGKYVYVFNPERITSDLSEIGISFSTDETQYIYFVKGVSFE